MCIRNLVKFCPFFLEILSGNKIQPSLKGRNSVENYKNVMGYMTKMATMPVYSKNFKIFFGTRSLTIKLGMDCQGLKVYKLYINDDPGLTLTYFMARYNLVKLLCDYTRQVFR